MSAIEDTLRKLPDGTDAVLKMKDGTERKVNVHNEDGDVTLASEDSDSLDLTQVEDVVLRGDSNGEYTGPGFVE